MNIELLNPNNKDVKEKIIKNMKKCYLEASGYCNFYNDIESQILLKIKDIYGKELKISSISEYLIKKAANYYYDIKIFKYFKYVYDEINEKRYVENLEQKIINNNSTISTLLNTEYIHIKNTDCDDFSNCLINTYREFIQNDNFYELVVYYTNMKCNFIDELNNKIIDTNETLNLKIKANYETLNNKITVIDKTSKANYETLNNKITVFDETNKANYETLNNKFTDIDETIKDNYETLNNKITDIKNNYEFLNNKIIDIEKTIKNNYETLNLKINCVIFIIFIIILI